MTLPHTDAPAADAGAAPVIHRRLEGGVLWLRFDRPAQRNPLSFQALAQLQAALDTAAADGAVRAIAIAGSGPAFCAGHDLKEMTAHRDDADGGRAFYETLFAACSRLMQSIQQHPKVIVAQVNGVATAAGCQLVAACDIAIAADTARFGVNGINSGLFCSTPMVEVSRNLGRKRIMELLTLGRLMDAREALEAGLVTRIVPLDRLESETQAVAEALAERSSAVLALGKRAFYRQIDMPLDAAHDHAARVIVDNMMMEDAKEGIEAFLTRRKPQWRDA